MLVWLGSVTFCSYSVRALSVRAPSVIIRQNVGAPLRPSLRIAVVLRPSTEIASTWLPASAAARGAGVEAEVAGCRSSGGAGVWACAQAGRTRARTAAPAAVPRRD